ncbi:MAG: hypothetical protein QG633_278 [Patescibacteria group bacterium]|nr:hypothetical protein [Patescibacteria group bacterium]
MKTGPSSAEANERPESSRNRSSSGIAGEDSIALATTARAIGGKRDDVPAALDKERANHTEHVVGITDVESVCEDVDEERTLLAAGLSLHHREHLREAGLRLVAELVEDRLVERIPRESCKAERGLALGLLGLPEEPGLEVVAKVGTNSPILLQLEFLGCDEWSGGRQYEARTQTLEEGRNRRLLDLEDKATVEDAASDFLTADLLHQRVQLTARPVLRNPSHGALLGLRCPEHSASLN